MKHSHTNPPRQCVAVVKNPAGTYYLAGWGIPAALGYVRKDGTAPSAEDLAAARQCGPGFAGLRTRTWATSEDACTALRAEGIEPSQIEA
jgi:hypothetical protein